MTRICCTDARQSVVAILRLLNGERVRVRLCGVGRLNGIRQFLFTVFRLLNGERVRVRLSGVGVMRGGRV